MRVLDGGFVSGGQGEGFLCMIGRRSTRVGIPRPPLADAVIGPEHTQENNQEPSLPLPGHECRWAP